MSMEEIDRLQNIIWPALSGGKAEVEALHKLVALAVAQQKQIEALARDSAFAENVPLMAEVLLGFATEKKLIVEQHQVIWNAEKGRWPRGYWAELDRRLHRSRPGVSAKNLQRKVEGRKDRAALVAARAIEILRDN